MREDKDDFEFKPLTEGLGFHKKVMDLKEDPSAYTANTVTGIMPKPRQQQSVPRPISHPLGWTPALKNLKIEEKQEKILLTQCPVAWSAGFFDAIMVGGLSLLFSAAV